MKKHLSLVVFLLSVTLFAATLPRKITTGGALERYDSIVIVKGKDCPLVAYAAKELQECLERILEKKVTVATATSPSALSIVLGDCPQARKIGLELSSLAEEGFFIRKQGRVVHILGLDSDTKAPSPKFSFNVEYPRGTLTGVYDFLERFAGVRFFFPGEYGTIAPKREALTLPADIDIVDCPDMFFRRFSLHNGRIPFPAFEDYDLKKLRQCMLPRLRESEKRYNFGHGLNGLDYIRRFSKTHPEYFALRADGKRYYEASMLQTGQLCFSSGIREEIYQDAKAYFTGQPASSRGMERWSTQTACDGIFGLMPQDGMVWCKCPECAKIWSGDPKNPDDKMLPAISTFMFQFFSEIDRRLTEEGIPHKLTTMAYWPYCVPPDFPLSNDLYIQVAVTGIGGNTPTDQFDTALLKRWHDRTGRKVAAWTYAMGKHNAKLFPGVPAVMPRHAANFLKVNKEYLGGVYFESETDQFLFGYLNFYIIQKLMWNTSLDVEDLLADHFNAMFGKGAPFMEAFYADLEKNWTEKILGNTVDTPLGPVTKVPDERKVWKDIYSQEKLSEYDALFDKAQAAANGDDEALGRLAYVRKMLLGAIKAKAQYYHELQRGLDFWIAPCPGSVWLRPYRGDACEVNTKVSLRREDNLLVVRCDCEEPRMADLKAVCTARDDEETFHDSAFEALLNPSGDRKNYFHFVVNPNGALSDYRWIAHGKPDLAWNSGATATAGREDKSWWAEIRIPLADIGALEATEFPVNFARNRVLTTFTKRDDFYMWSLYQGTYSGGFHDIETWGRLKVGGTTENLIKNGNFEKLDPKTKCAEGWGYWNKPGATVSHDEKCFITGGRSLKFELDGTRNNNMSYKLPFLKTGKKYRLSFFLKTEKLEGEIGAGAYLYFSGNNGVPFPRTRILGTNPWHRVTCEFTAPQGTGDKGFVPVLGLWAWKAKGTLWYDEVQLIEVP